MEVIFFLANRTLILKVITIIGIGISLTLILFYFYKKRRSETEGIVKQKTSISRLLLFVFGSALLFVVLSYLLVGLLIQSGL